MYAGDHGARDVPRSERYRKLARIDEERVWSVVCFFIDARARRQGLMLGLLNAAVAYALSRGARIVEGYPVEPGRIYAYMGSPAPSFPACRLPRRHADGAREDGVPVGVSSGRLHADAASEVASLMVDLAPLPSTPAVLASEASTLAVMNAAVASTKGRNASAVGESAL